jgi:hypothetical protein
MRQLFIGRNKKLADDMAFERKLYVIRREWRMRFVTPAKWKAANFFTLPASLTRR